MPYYFHFLFLRNYVTFFLYPKYTLLYAINQSCHRKVVITLTPRVFVFRMRIQKLGKFNFFTSYMSQPKFQLETFRAWAGLGSDISYYLNSHHVDLHVWAMEVHRSIRCT